jgi:hypothetical protein
MKYRDIKSAIFKTAFIFTFLILGFSFVTVRSFDLTDEYPSGANSCCHSIGLTMNWFISELVDH